MELFVWNSLTNKKEKFTSLIHDESYKGDKKDFVGFYSCGPTVYGTPSIGNMRTFLLGDIAKNTLKHFLDLPVKHVMNITDVGHLVNDADVGEDKIELGAKKEGLTARDIAIKYEKEFMEHMGKMNIGDIDHFPTATGHIPEQIAMIKKLIEKGHTYTIENDGIYFDTSTIDDYGKLLTPEHLEGLRKGARVAGAKKKSATDFALWKFSPKNQTRHMERIFDGPRESDVINKSNRDTLTAEELERRGFPGWHIECSAMAIKYLGTNIDFHVGGIDLKSVHHPNEICQAEHSFCDHDPWVKYWLHGQFITVGGEKMSKSLGNVFSVNDVEHKGFSGIDLRYMYFLGHYRNFIDFTREGLERASKARKKLQKKFKNYESNQQFSSWKDLKDTTQGGPAMEFIETIEESLGNDFNVPQVIAAINKLSHNELDQETINVLTYVEDNLLKVGLFDGDAYIEIPAKINALAKQRLKAKLEKNYALADELREQINATGYSIEDTSGGYHIEKL